MSRLKNNHAPRSHPSLDALTVTLNHHQSGRYDRAEVGCQICGGARPSGPGIVESRGGTGEQCP
ncbi:MAG: hypothetical protein IPP12_02235 [Nitrospira sp.]|nr:hypothetical protein [Nitrospira sp.]